MTTKVNTRCYRFADVDFEPESRTLYWTDQTITVLSYEESRMLEMLCYYAGEVLSSRTLFKQVALPDSSFAQHQSVVTSLMAKSYRNGKKCLPFEVVGEFGYRVALPQQTLSHRPAPRTQPQADEPPSLAKPDDLQAADFSITKPLIVLLSAATVIIGITALLT
ncbi:MULTISPECIES: hypothetical protein [Salinivibrio]|jgi:DNA-binding winged helix-turn-helix (wHTH) protein|uniref:OmpR/PhoB-type domain-containing protein n=1 Tax=Salinivibrio costicola TaxID=51367 RepID=A0ABX6K3U3_SALCS|nr:MULTISPECIES: hypothetical protein [Salinivibrio]OOF24658.1 hypothetical protein BZJ17_00585 [Salinivibrio sp. IB574]OOF27725.1 hypothetical protein BZJ18_06935 [Salinivibrio sp. IB872]PCE67299.1 hypothetical protein B6G00_02720 [Salinivibrio sp. YCSC6]QCF35797.1 hypothetical protein E8E00_06260 [Salinivibrio sp. YCSC6]QIR06221.1 hypothetical protein HBA18_07430 [Salinivibrio costicola]